jgi:hypothetical protein
MSEADFMRRCLKRATEMGARLFRNNVGRAWVGDEAIKMPNGKDVLLRNARPFRSGVPGMSDLIGWVPVTITPGMVGQTVAVYAAVETKTARGRATEEQKAFISVVSGAGGMAGIARTDADLDKILSAQGVVEISTRR